MVMNHEIQHNSFGILTFYFLLFCIFGIIRYSYFQDKQQQQQQQQQHDGAVVIMRIYEQISR